jgi:hypothetical protein
MGEIVGAMDIAGGMQPGGGMKAERVDKRTQFHLVGPCHVALPQADRFGSRKLAPCDFFHQYR